MDACCLAPAITEFPQIEPVTIAGMDKDYMLCNLRLCWVRAILYTFLFIMDAPCNHHCSLLPISIIFSDGHHGKIIMNVINVAMAANKREQLSWMMEDGHEKTFKLTQELNSIDSTIWISSKFYNFFSWDKKSTNLTLKV